MADINVIGRLDIKGMDIIRRVYDPEGIAPTYRINVHNENWSIVNGRVDDALKDKFPDSEICGRFIIHPGVSEWQQHASGREVAVVNQDDKLYRYYNYDGLREILDAKNTKENLRHKD